ncbi:signal peptidase II [Paracandidimonas lactea]|uniref:signal peptidase II n=1 Tax=Paracandidimonas lactea TaxID=2895524 RepID=UPI001F0115AC|nr:signal peptidase II [Paracandidimonas lactea]
MMNKLVQSSARFPFRAHPLRWWSIAMAVLGLDVASKAAISMLMPYGKSIPLTGFFNLTHVWNTGAAFSVLADAGGWQRYPLIALAFGISIWLILELRKPLPSLEAWAYSAILGGALGNAVDRLLRGHVVDYLDFQVASWHWPAFNIADIGIVSGAALLLWASLRQTGDAMKENPSG